MTSQAIKVLIVDDHPMVRKGLALFVGGFEDMALVGEAEDSASAMQLFDLYQPDVVLMDMVLPDVPGAETIRRMCSRREGVCIIALTSYADPEMVEVALRAGARGFLHKNVGIDELAEAIRLAHRGGIVLDSRASQVVVHRMLGSRPENASPGHRAALSEREREVLALLVQGLTNKQIAARMDLQLSTVKQYISSILSKLNAQSRTEAVTLALRQGLVGDK